jgi:hypothetical protein
MANASAALPPVRNLQYQLSRRPGESKGQSGRCGEEKKSLASQGSNGSPFAQGVRRVFNRITGHKGTVNGRWRNSYPFKVVHSTN